MISRNEFRIMLDRVEDKCSKAQKADAALREEEASLESELHDQVESFLRRNGIPYIHSRMDRRSTIRKGWPDFTAMRNSRVACVELKTKNGKLSADQQEVVLELQRAGVPITVCSNLMKAIRFLIENLLEEK